MPLNLVFKGPVSHLTPILIYLDQVFHVYSYAENSSIHIHRPVITDTVIAALHAPQGFIKY